jgi:hypothetical protein
VSNLILRLAWALTISPESIGIVMDPVLFTSILAGIEIARRAQWNIFRLENEQLNNIEKYRAIEVTVPLMIVNTGEDKKSKVATVPKNVIAPLPVQDVVSQDKVVVVPFEFEVSVDSPPSKTRNRKNAWAT